MAFRGYHDITLDAKNRLTIPARLRAPFAGGAVVALQRDNRHCVAIWRVDDFNAHVESVLGALHPLSPEYVKLERYYNAYATEVELDAAGRVMVPGKLIETVGLGREVAVVGAGNRLEVWNREAWGVASADMLETVKDIGPESSNGHTA